MSRLEAQRSDLSSVCLAMCSGTGPSSTENLSLLFLKNFFFFKKSYMFNLFFKLFSFFLEWSVIKVFFGLVTVLLLLYVLAFLAKRHVGS